MTESKYCGLDCGELLEKQKELLDQCVIHSKYDPEFAPIMVQKLIDQAQQVKAEIVTKSSINNTP